MRTIAERSALETFESLSVHLEDVDVDSGQVMFADAELLAAHLGTDQDWIDAASPTHVPPGFYRAQDDRDDVVSFYPCDAPSEVDHSVVAIPSGQLIISDPCYLLDGDDYDAAMAASSRPAGRGVTPFGVLVTGTYGDGSLPVGLCEHPNDSISVHLFLGGLPDGHACAFCERAL